MKYLNLVGTVLMCLVIGLKTTQATFVEGLEDIPLAEGLTPIEGNNLNFGNEEIRLVETYLQSASLDFDAISKFYRDTLPQMGWSVKKQNQQQILFERDNEILEINKESANPLVIRLTVKSKN